MFSSERYEFYSISCVCFAQSILYVAILIELPHSRAKIPKILELLAEHSSDIAFFSASFFAPASGLKLVSQ
jgi:hypothetical protein